MNSMGTEQEVDETMIKNTRPLIEVEVETQYPIFPSKVQFRILKAQDKRDGYMELKCTDENLINIYMKRIDSSIQVAPAFLSTEAQTICTYPKNSATQYLYDVEKQEDLPIEWQHQIVRYANDNLDNLSDLLKVNGFINMYANDFDALVKDFSALENNKSIFKEYEEYMFFLDVGLCKGKMICDIYWHQMWTGTVAISYGDIAPNIFYSGQNKDDEVYKAVHGVNPVLIWSIKDCLKPKLILESPREVQCLSFCKFDENILVGGCKNGQIIIWDIRNKLQKVEEKEVLTTAQQKYRNYMHSLMKWMKNIHDISIIRPTVISDLRYSHKDAISALTWMDPFFEFSKMGNISQMDEESDDKYSMQLISSSVDGSICIWDLKKKPIVDSGGYRPKRLKRLKKRPSALEIDVSPFRSLHLNWRPIYKINVNKKSNRNKPVMVTKCASSFCNINYEEVNPGKGKLSFKERLIYKPIWESTKTLDDIKPVVEIGTVDGNISIISWEGQDFDSGETVNSEQAKFLYDARYHDGPINWLQMSSVFRITLSVGGKIFALWRPDLTEGPILWRRSRHIYTKGEFNIFEPFKILLLTLNGVLQKWVLSVNSKGPLFNQVMSDGFLTTSALHPFALKKNIFGLGDEQGAFRLFSVPEANVAKLELMTNEMNNFLDREINRKHIFYKWQDDFNKKNEAILKMNREAAEKAKHDEKEKDAMKVDDKTTDKDLGKGPQPGKYIEWVKEQRQISEQARIKAMIINKKQLDTKELEKRRKPLQKLDEENERKKRKQKQRLKEGEHIFRETVESLFPDVLKEKPIPPPDPYTTTYEVRNKENAFANYEQLAEDASDFISNNPYHYDFSYKTLLVGNRKKFQQDIKHIHKKRLEIEKQLRRGDSSVMKEDDLESESRASIKYSQDTDVLMEGDI